MYVGLLFLTQKPHHEILTPLSAQRFADYENDIRVLTAELRLAKKRNDSFDSTTTAESTKAATPANGLSRFGSFMHSRKTSTLAPTPISRERELESQLAQSQAQRLAAEAKVDAMSAEIEELTGSLFSQANEMVADERREGARLRERIRFLEERDAKFAMKVQRIEERDRERKKRLERLERAMARIEKAKERGEIARGADPTALAYLASATLHTLAVRARAGLPRRELNALVDAAIGVICAKP